MNTSTAAPNPERLVSTVPWRYEEAFMRNLGLIRPGEQQSLRASRVAIAGMGGVGGVDAVSLARLGIGKFTIADPDIFEVRNTNRQYGAMRSTVNRFKAEVMRDIIRDINPEAEVRIFCEHIDAGNVDAFLEGADVFIDGVDAFEIDLRRMLFRRAQEKGIYALSAGPFGFSTGWVIFDPNGMTFERYCDFSDSMDIVEKFAAFITGMTPAATHRGTLDFAYVDVKECTGPSVGLACNLASGVVGAEVVKILLCRGRVFCAPYFHQFDAYENVYVRKRLWGGNRHPLQILKRRRFASFLRQRLAAATAASEVSHG